MSSSVLSPVPSPSVSVSSVLSYGNASSRSEIPSPSSSVSALSPVPSPSVSVSSVLSNGNASLASSVPSLSSSESTMSQTKSPSKSLGRLALSSGSLPQADSSASDHESLSSSSSTL